MHLMITNDRATTNATNRSCRCFRIQNLVASTAVGYPLDLEAFADTYGTSVSYEPDMFPGLVLRIPQPKLVLLCFRSGRIVITGARSRVDVNGAFASVYTNILTQFFVRGAGSCNSAEYRHECAHRHNTDTLLESDARRARHNTDTVPEPDAKRARH